LYELREYCSPLPVSITATCTATSCYKVATTNLPSSISLTVPTPNPIIFEPLGQGVYDPTSSMGSYTSAILTGAGFNKEIDVTAVGQVNSVDLALAPTPTIIPTTTPTLAPTATPTLVPTATPTLVPTATPTLAPTATPTLTPTPTPIPAIAWWKFDETSGTSA